MRKFTGKEYNDGDGNTLTDLIILKYSNKTG